MLSRVGLMGMIKVIDEINDERAETDRSNRLVREDEKIKRKQAEAAGKLVEQENAVADVYTEAMDAQAKADFDALEDAEKLNVLLEFRLKLLRDIANGGKASVENAKRFAAVARLGPDIAALQDEVGTQPGTANAPAVATARSRALAANPALQATLDRQAQLQSMTARDRVLSLNPALQNVFAKTHGMGKTDIQETEKGVWRLVELAEGEGLKILPTNGE